MSCASARISRWAFICSTAHKARPVRVAATANTATSTRFILKSKLIRIALRGFRRVFKLEDRRRPVQLLRPHTIVEMAADPAQCSPHAGSRCSVNSPDIKDPTNSPFMVAVSGHRDLAPQDTPRLREAVTTFVQQLQAYLPDTELRLIVGMAEGADLLVAETALAL